MNPAALNAAAKGDIENFLVAATPGGIERQEAQGQQQLVQSTNMPIDLNGEDPLFVILGFTFGPPIDEIFREATLPAGWTRAATDHSMHSVLLDDKGRERVGVFYKAAFYDRRAHAYLKPRYNMTWQFPAQAGEDPNGLDSGYVAYAVFDCGKEIHRFEPTEQSDLEADAAQEKIAKAYMEEHYPDAKNPLAYWDQP